MCRCCDQVWHTTGQSVWLDIQGLSSAAPHAARCSTMHRDCDWSGPGDCDGLCKGYSMSEWLVSGKVCQQWQSFSPAQCSVTWQSMSEGARRALQCSECWLLCCCWPGEADHKS